MSAKWRSSKTSDDGARGGHPLEERAPGGEELLRAARRALDPEQRQQRRLDPAPLGLVGDVLGDRLGDLRPGRRLVVGLEQAARPRTISPRAQKLIPSP